MKNGIGIALAVFTCCGCSTYQLQRGQRPYDQGYVMARDGIPIAEYTVGRDNTVPADKKLAQGRFKRRRWTVERYYKQMDRMDERIEQYPQYLLLPFQALFSVVTTPWRLYKEYKYAHDKDYQREVDAAAEEKDKKKQERINLIKGELQAYIEKDIAAEPEAKAVPAAAQEAAPVEPPQRRQPRERQRVVGKETARAEGANADIKAVIVARPARGYSPLRVRFSCAGSSSRAGKIIACEWDFGDGDKSSLKSPVNTYYSASSQPRQFLAALTVRDSKGNTATSSVTIEVLNK